MPNQLRGDKFYLTRNEAYILCFELSRLSEQLTKKIKKNAEKEKPRCMSDEWLLREALDKLTPQLCRFYQKADAEIVEERKEENQ